MIEIVPYSKHYRAGVVDVILPVQQDEFGIPITLDTQPDLLDIPGFYQRNNGNFWVAIDGSRVVGTIALLDIGDGRGALRKMFVSKPYRGSDRGVARSLLQTLLEWCRHRKMSEIFLGTTARFRAAHRFYEKNGFTEIPKAALPANFPIMSVDTRFYRRSIAVASACGKDIREI